MKLETIQLDLPLEWIDGIHLMLCLMILLLLFCLLLGYRYRQLNIGLITLQRALQSGDRSALSSNDSVLPKTPLALLTAQIKAHLDHLPPHPQEDTKPEAMSDLFADVIPDNLVRMNGQGDYLEVRYARNAPFTAPAAELVGRNIYEVMPQPTADLIMSKIREAIATRQVVHYEYERDLDGQRYHMESRIIAKNDHEIIAIVRDITERHQADAMIRHQARLVNSVSDLIISVDREFRITSWNHAASILYACKLDEVLGNEWDEFFQRSPSCASLQAIVATIQAQGSWQGEEIHVVPNRGEIILMGVISPIYDKMHSESGFVAVLRNITEEKRAQQLLPLAQQSESIKTLAGGIAHDFNNLFAGILSYLSLAIEQYTASEQSVHYLHKARQVAERAADLTRQLLAFTGQGAYIVEPLDLNQMIRDNVGLLKAILPTGAKLTLSLAENLPLLEMDRGHAQQVIMNLLINAGEALHDGSGEITIVTKLSTLLRTDLNSYLNFSKLQPGTYLQLQICDDGAGMSAAVQQRIFQPYFTTKQHGSGLGLAATLGIVDRYNGGIQVESTVGEGTQFSLIFPLARQTQRTEQPTQITAEPSPPLTTQPNKQLLHSGSAEGCILIIDDEATVRETFGEILATIGFHVISADGGYQGIEQFRLHQHMIDIVLLDMNMPGMNGLQTLQALRTIDPTVKVILCSGYSEREVLSAPKQHDLVAFLQKPVRIAELLSTIRSAINR